MFFEKVIRPALYRLGKNDPELVHERTLHILSKLGEKAPTQTSSTRALRKLAVSMLHKRYGKSDPVEVLGLHFPNRVGLAAGMDKDGRALAVWQALGFGFVEAGTVTRLAQPGNPKPRLFVLPNSGALINRMGFNNAGAKALAHKLAAQGKPTIPLGISLGKSKATALEDAISDYQESLRSLYPYADYFAINVSSPNTPGLRSLQDRSALSELLSQLQAASTSAATEMKRTTVPLLVKISPDLSPSALEELLEVCEERKVAGIIATNTTLSREGLPSADTLIAQENGGLSGNPLTNRSLDTVRFIHKHTDGKLPIIGVGGISNGYDAQRILDAGASLVQIYTGFALSGPALIRQINQELLKNKSQHNKNN